MPRQVVKVVWRDCCGTCRWLSLEQAIEWSTRAFNEDHVTVGYLLYKDKRFVVVASSHDADGGYNDVSMIPRALVKGIVKVGT